MSSYFQKTKQIYSLLNTSLLLLFLFLEVCLWAQHATTEQLQEWHHEVIDQPYVAVLRANMEKSPAYRVFTPNYFTTQVNVDENGNNIVGDAANEPSIAVDPTNPNRIVIGWRQFDTVDNNFRQAGNGYSLDGGYTWVFQEVLEPGVFRSDPVLDFDAHGNLYYNSLRNTPSFACDVFKITDGGQDWGAPFPANGGDKQWMRMDRTGGTGDGNNYSYWSSSFSFCAPEHFTRSIDGSNTFEDCETISGDPRWGTLAVDADGALYVAGTSPSGIVVAKSSTANDPNMPVSWDSFILVDMDGTIRANTAVNPQGLLGQVWIDVDRSNGLGDGNVYVLASVYRASIGDPGDVMFIKSTDGGQIFSPPIRINTDEGTGAHQWFGTMSVAPNGRIDVVWLDTRDATNDIDSVLYYSFSEDQGDSWSDNEPISLPFDPSIGYPQQNKMGDYFDMVSDNDFAHLAWANTINGGQDVYYSRISPYGILGVAEVKARDTFQFKVSPNPVVDKTTLEFNMASEGKVTIDVYDIQGRKLSTLLDEEVMGKQRLVWDRTNHVGVKLSAGLYFIVLKTKSKQLIVKVLLL